jgi:hypothetical protein
MTTQWSLPVLIVQVNKSVGTGSDLAVKMETVPCLPILYLQQPLGNHFALKMETVRISEMSTIQPTYIWFHHLAAGSTLALNSCENLKSSNFFQF